MEGFGKDPFVRVVRPLALATGFALLALALAAGLAPRAQALDAEIRRTAHGIPHIKAEGWADMGYGYGYAFAQDNICTIADSYVTVNGERSRYFGPQGSWTFQGNGYSANNLNSDFFFKRIIDDGRIEKLLNQPPPAGPVDAIKEGVRGYVAGYNRYLAETGVENIPDPRCKGAPWVRPITEMDTYRRFYQLALLASGGVAIDGIGSAQPPLPDTGAAAGAAPRLDEAATAAALQRGLEGGLGIGSNAYGLGKEATSNGKGIVLANPHFPWSGSERFYQAQLTIPSKGINVTGGSLYGVPLILIGHTDNLAWSHTVSTAFRFTPYQETINPLNTTQYLYDGQWKQMKRDTVTVMVRTDGGLEPRTRTLYSTEHGPVINSLVGVPLPWTPIVGFTMKDANATNFRYLNHFFFTNQAQSVEELDQVERTYQGIPWVNTIAADSKGKAYYADIGSIPHVTDEKVATCNTALGVATHTLLGLPILDGARSVCEWGSDPDAAAPGILGPAKQPSIFRDDYVTNSNDSYWLTNPEQPLEGYDRIIGDERAPRTLRTRLGLKIVEERLAGTDGLPGNKFDRQGVQDAVFNDRQFAGELWRDQLVALCSGAPAGFLLGSNGLVDVSDACPVLANWDLHTNLDSEGAVLFQRFAGKALAGLLPLPLPFGVGNLLSYTHQFDVNDPVNTPRGLNTLSPTVIAAFADAVTDLRSSGIPLDAAPRDYQYVTRTGEKIPIHGGPGDPEGSFNAINLSWRQGEGYSSVPHGSSFVMVTQFTDGCPDDRSIVTYSQSENPNSPYYKDQTKMYSNKQWVDPPYCEAEILADPSLQTTRLTDQPQGRAAAKKKRKCRKAKRRKPAKSRSATDAAKRKAPKRKAKKKRCKRKKPAKRKPRRR